MIERQLIPHVAASATADALDIRGELVTLYARAFTMAQHFTSHVHVYDWAIRGSEAHMSSGPSAMAPPIGTFNALTFPNIERIDRTGLCTLLRGYGADLDMLESFVCTLRERFAGHTHGVMDRLRLAGPPCSVTTKPPDRTKYPPPARPPMPPLPALYQQSDQRAYFVGLFARLAVAQATFATLQDHVNVHEHSWTRADGSRMFRTNVSLFC